MRSDVQGAGAVRELLVLRFRKFSHFSHFSPLLGRSSSGRLNHKSRWLAQESILGRQ